LLVAYYPGGGINLIYQLLRKLADRDFLLGRNVNLPPDGLVRPGDIGKAPAVSFYIIKVPGWRQRAELLFPSFPIKAGR
jgi:hypothetical protein